jgi:mRNA interferase MazF
MIKRGEIYWIDWERGKGSEQAGRRPGLIIQNDLGNQASPNVIVASLTTAPNKAYPFLVLFKAREAGLNRDGCVDLASIMTISKDRLQGKCGELSKGKMAEVNLALCVSLGIPLSV